MTIQLLLVLFLAAFGEIVFPVDLQQDDGNHRHKQEEYGDKPEGAAVGRNGGVKAGDYRHHHGGGRNDNPKQKRQVAVEEIRDAERGKVSHENPDRDEERDDVQEAEHPAVRAEERCDCTLAQAIPIFVLEMLEHASTQIA